MPFELQGHRGARALRPENTLPSFEMALDAGVSSIETDVHLTRDGVPVLIHDPWIPAGPDRTARLMIAEQTLAELRGLRVSANPDPLRFPDQHAELSPVALAVAAERDVDPYGVPTLEELCALVRAYAGRDGERAGKTAAQRARASRVKLDLELKRVPFEPGLIGDDFDGSAPGLLERQVVAAVRAAWSVERTVVRGFDHRSVRAVRELEAGLTTAILVAETAPVAPADLARQAGASIYCPDYRFIDERLVRHAHAAGLRVLPWTVNEPSAWERLLAWGVDGITTDDPGRLAVWLSERAVPVA
jgi:glycerophosphoryl diester phosphodiesterase